MAIEQWFFPLLAIALLGVAKGGFGGVGAPIALPIMSLGMPIELALGALLPILLTMDAVNVFVHRRGANYREIAYLLPGALVGVVVSTWLIAIVPGRLVGVGVGVIAILFAIQSQFLKTGGIRELSPKLAPFFGWVSGVTSTLAHAGGPPLHIYLLARGYEQRNFVATANIFIAVTNVAKIVPFVAVGALDRESLAVATILSPFAVAAAGGGFILSRILPKPVFMVLVNALMIVAGTKLIFDAFL